MKIWHTNLNILQEQFILILAITIVCGNLSYNIKKKIFHFFKTIHTLVVSYLACKHEITKLPIHILKQKQKDIDYTNHVQNEEKSSSSTTNISINETSTSWLQYSCITLETKRSYKKEKNKQKKTNKKHKERREGSSLTASTSTHCHSPFF